MSREDLKNFFHSVQHSSSLRTKIQRCEDYGRILELAKDYGFSITLKDLTEDNTAMEIENWFEVSKIPPLK